MTQFQPLRLYRNKTSKQTAHNLRTVLPERLTVRADYRVAKYEAGKATLFDEVEFVPKADAVPKTLRGLFVAPIGTETMDRAEYLIRIGQAMQTAIEQAWHPSKMHLVFHSGGYDSRILSSAIRRLADMRGPEWLGRLLFVCIGNEVPTFEQVMQIQGWAPDVWTSVPDVGPLVAKMVDFDDAGRWLNGVTMQAVDYNWLLIEHLQEKGLLPDSADIQLISGRNETLMGATMPGKNMLSKFWGEAYESHLAISRYKCNDVVFPFSVANVIRLALSSTVRMDWSDPTQEEKCHFRRDIGLALNPSLLGVPHRTIEIPDLTLTQWAEMKRAYQDSWYGREVWPGAVADIPRKALGAHAWWGAFSAAALCEALRREGYVLHVG